MHLSNRNLSCFEKKALVQVVKSLLLLVCLMQGVVAQIPEVRIVAPSTALLGDTFSFELSIENQDADVIGYDPIIELVLPALPENEEGSSVYPEAPTLSYRFVEASYLGNPIYVEFVGHFDSEAGVLTHPLTGELVNGSPRSGLYLLHYPLSSIAPNQPAPVIAVNAKLNGLAPIAPHEMSARGVFNFGADPTGNASSIFGEIATHSVMPSLLTLRKQVSYPESESATGPSFPGKWSLIGNVASEAVLQNVEITDQLPDNFFVTDISVIRPAGGTLTVSEADLGGRIDAVWSEVSGSSANASSEVLIEVEGYIAEQSIDETNVLSTISGEATSENQFSASYTFEREGIDPEGGYNASEVSNLLVVDALTLALQKDAQIADDQLPSGLSPKDTVEFILDLQVSDFKKVEQVRIIDGVTTAAGLVSEADILGDGLSFDHTYAPTYTASIGDEIVVGVFSEQNFSVAENPENHLSGSSRLVFDLSQQLIDDAHFDADGILTGADQLGNLSTAGTTAQIRYRASVDTDFDTPDSGDSSVDLADYVFNDVDVVAYDLVDNIIVGDESNIALQMQSLNVSHSIKRIVSVEGVVTNQPSEVPYVSPEDQITLALRFSIPTGDVENLVVNNFLPYSLLSVIEANGDGGDPLIFNPIVTATPTAGQLTYGPADEYGSSYTSYGQPIFSISSIDNSFSLDFGSIDTTSVVDADRNNDGVYEFELYYTLVAGEDQLPDGFLMTSLAQLTHGSTNAGEREQRAYTGLYYSRSEVVVTKGVIGCDNLDSLVSPVASSEFEYAGAVGKLTNAGAGDRVTFAITVTNVGSDPISFLRIEDVLPSGFDASAAKIVSVRRADGTSIEMAPAVDGIPNTADEGALFAGALELDSTVDDNYLASGSVANGVYGAETLVLILEVPLVDDITPGARFENVATARVWYDDEDTNGDPYDEDTGDVDIELVSIQMDKALVVGQTGDDASTSAVMIEETLVDVFTIGEIVTYDISFEVPHGVAHDLILTDRLPNGLSPFAIEGVSAKVVSIDEQIDSTFLNAGDNDKNSAHITIESDLVSFDFGTLSRAVDSGSGLQNVVVRVHALVEDTVINSQGLVQRNVAGLNWAGGSAEAACEFTVVRPNLILEKVMRASSGSVVQAGTDMVVELTLSNLGDADAVSAAHDFVLEDLLESDFFDGSSIEEMDTPENYTFSTVATESGVKIVYAGSIIERGAIHVFRFKVNLVNDLSLLTSLENTAIVTGTSLPGVSFSNVESIEVDQDLAQLRTSFPTMTKTFVASSETHTSDQPLNVTIGEQVVYRLRVDVPEGVLPSLKVIDRVPDGMDFVGSNTDELLTFPGAGYSLGGPMAEIMHDRLSSIVDLDPTPESSLTDDGNGKDITFNFASFTNPADGDESNDYFYIDLEFVVLDVPSVIGHGSSAKVLKNRARVFCAGMLNGEGWSRNVKATVVEPNLVLGKNIVESGLEGGDRFTVQLSIANEGASAAYDIVLEDPIAGQYFQTNQIEFSEKNPEGWTLLVDPMSVDSDATVRIASDLGVAVEVGQSLLFEFSVPADDAIPVASSIVNTATLAQVTSLDGSKLSPVGISERNSGGATASDDIVFANADLGLSFVSSSEADTSDLGDVPNLTIGERALLRVDVDLPDGTFVNPSLILELPSGLDFVGGNNSSELMYSGFGYGGFYGSLGTGAKAAFNRVIDNDSSPLESILLDGSGVDVIFAFNSIVNLPDGDENNNDFHFYIEVVVVDEVALVGYGDTPSELSVGARMLGSNAAADALAHGVLFQIVEPKLSIDKSMTPIDPLEPDLVSVSIVVSNDGRSPAYDLRIEDVLDDALFDRDSVVAVHVPEEFTFSNDSGVVSYAFEDASLAPGSSLELSFTVKVLTTAPSPLANTAKVVSSSSLNHGINQPVGVGERQGGIVENSAELGIPVVRLLKKAIDLNYTGEPLSPGDLIEYTLTATNIGGARATSVELLESIPQYTSFVPGSMKLNGELHASSLPNISIDLGVLDPTESQTITFQVAVDDVLPAEAREISNSASLTYAERSMVVVSDNDATGHDPVEDDRIDSVSDAGEFTDDDDPTVLPLLQAAVTKRSYLAFEDLKNRGWSDWDHNDLLLDITTHTVTDGSGGVKSVIVLYQILARGAAYEAEVYLTLPYTGAGNWKTEYLEADGSLISSGRGSGTDSMTAEVYASTRDALAPYAEGRYAWGASRTERFDPTPVGRRSVVHLVLDEPSSNPLEGLSESPHDTWAHMVNSGEDVHRVEYEIGNTQIALTGPLAGRSLPLVVEFSEGFDWAAETNSIFYSHPEYVDYIKSGGSSHLDWWRTYDEALIWVDAEGNVPGVASYRKSLLAKTRSVAKAKIQNVEAEAWPKQLSGLVAASPVLRDLTGDSIPEILISSMDGKVSIFNGAGDLLPGWPQAVEIRPTGDSSDLALRASPSVGDIDGDGELDIVVGAPSGRVYAWDLDGTRKSKFPVYLGGSIKSVCALVDLDGDAAAEIIVHSGNSVLNVIDGSGVSLAGWPQSLGGDQDRFGSWMMGSSPTVFDLNLDGSLQIAVGSTANQVHIFNVNGSKVDGWPATTGDWILPTIAAVDLDGDYEPEIVAGSGDHKVYAWNAEGELMSGFPAQLDGAVVGSAATGDVTGDGVNELVVATMAGSVYALTAEGSVVAGWPKSAQAAIVSSPIIIDVDGDNKLDVVATSRDNWLYAWCGSGEPITSEIVKSSDWIEATPAAGDVDGDGLIEIVYVVYDGTLELVDLSSSATDQNLAWPAFRGDRAVSADAVATDFDQDRLPDALEMELFGNYSVSGSDDEDGDGFDNASEWIAGSSLFYSSDRFAISSEIVSVDGASKVRLSWIGRAGRTYKVYCCDTVGADTCWELVEVDAINSTDVDRVMTWTSDAISGQSCQFFRVVVERSASSGESTLEIE